MAGIGDVAAFAVTSILPELTAYAARRCTKADFAEVTVLTNLALEVPTRPIAPLRDIRDYNRFLMRDLVEHVTTPFVLIFQWDGFLLDPARWSDEFLDYDYVGAPWTEAAAPPGQRVGNGGFSIRSRRLLEALQDPKLDYDPTKGEDQLICHKLRPALESRHGIRFAPLELARRFSFEHDRPADPTFGFHGHFNLPLAMPEDDLYWAIEHIPERLWTSGWMQRWIARTHKAGRHDLAKRLHRRCMQAFPERTAAWEPPRG